MLDPEARKELRSLTRETADLVSRHLVMTGRLLDEDPVRALAHARAARAMAGRIGVVREASGLAAYAAGEWAEALSELRASRRITGRPEHLAVLADCERALDRPERALAYADDPAVPGLPQEDRVELVIVIAGARRDLGQPDAAVVTLQDPAKRTTAKRPWAARLWYAFADALLAAGREDEARAWFSRAAEVDEDGSTDAGDRLLELDGVVLEHDDDEDDPDGGGLDDAALAAVVAEAFPRPVAEPVAERAGHPDVDGAAAETAAPAAQPSPAPALEALGTANSDDELPQEEPADADEPLPSEAESGRDDVSAADEPRAAEPSRAPFTAVRPEDDPPGDAGSRRTPPAAALTPSFVSPPSGPDDELTLFDQD